jgi:tetratricopeptide (TPR) repeat protein
MSSQKPSESISESTAVTAATASSNVTHPRQRIAQNVRLIWLDAKIDLSNKDCQTMFSELRNVVNDVHIFTQRDDCIDFLTEIDDMKAFLIVERTLSQQILSLIHDIPQLDDVYIFSNKKFDHKQWANTWVKVKGIYTEFMPMCESLQQAVKQCNRDSISVSFLNVGEGVSSQNLDQLEPSFMYTQLFKEILLEMEHDDQAIKNFTAYCRSGDYAPPNSITRFENDYNANSAIRWYTDQPFIFSLLNCALRMLEGGTIIHMGFFIRDLHRQIEEIHQKQMNSYQGKSFVVYRGQGLSAVDFNKLLKTKSGLMSFNNFLSTSKERDVSLGFAKSVLGKTDTVGILFQMSIDLSVSSTPFASIEEISQFQTEVEILFSMHTVFRIGEIRQMEKNNSLYEVELKLTSDDDRQLRILTERIREEARSDTGWRRIGGLLIKLNQFDEAEELHRVLLEKTSDEHTKALNYNQLGYIKLGQCDYEKALSFYEKSLEIRQKTRPPNHPDLAASYNYIGNLYQNMGEYSKALSYYEKALEIYQKTLPPNHPDLATSYSGIGLVYQNMGEYSKAVSFYEKSLEINQKTLPPNHPNLATSYNNIGLVYQNMEEYSKAVSFYEKSLEIYQKTLPPNHPDLATSYNKIGGVYEKMGEYSKALSFYEKSLEIRQKTLPPNHPLLATSYNNIGLVYSSMGEYSKALQFHEKTREIFEKTLPPNHPSLATSYNNIGLVYNKMGEYSKALSLYEKSLEIEQKTLPPNHPDLATSYNNIGGVYYNVKEYIKALQFYECTLKIFKSSLPANHPHLQTVRKSIEIVKENL